MNDSPACLRMTLWAPSQLTSQEDATSSSRPPCRSRETTLLPVLPEGEELGVPFDPAAALAEQIAQDLFRLALRDHDGAGGEGVAGGLAGEVLEPQPKAAVGRRRTC